MSRLLIALAVTSVALLPCANVFADDVYPLEPAPADLYDLAHAKYYTWGIDTPWPDGDMPIGAVLTLKSIRNWNDSPNDLYIHLLDDAPLGVSVYSDTTGDQDEFLGEGVLLVHYEDLPSTADTKQYEFTPQQIQTLNDYAEDGRFALGFDPDCHFYNCGVELDITGAPIPEPATMALLASGGALALLRRRRRK
jgi:hypothetical protein